MSKIKITQGVSMFAVLASMWGLDLSPEDQATLVAGIAIVSQVVTFVMRSYFNHENTKGVKG